MIAVAFVLWLWLPLSNNLLHFDTARPLQEKRVLAQPPKLSATWEDFNAFPKAFEDYFNDSFGLRNRLIRTYQSLKLGLFGISPTSCVLLGKQGWMFFGTQELLNNLKATDPFGEDDVRCWKEHLLDRDRRMRVAGTRFVFAFAPEKSSIYPEYLPFQYGKIGAKNRLDQIIEALPGIRSPVLDLRPILMQAKNAGIVYHKTDSHWNALGAYAAYRAIMQKLNALGCDVRELEPSRIHLTPQMQNGGDLAMMIGMREILREENPVLSIGRPQARDAEVDKRGILLGGNGKLYAKECAGLAGPRVVIFHNSFGNAVIPYFIETFHRTVVGRNLPFQELIISREKPDIVIQLHSERSFYIEEFRRF